MAVIIPFPASPQTARRRRQFRPGIGNGIADLRPLPSPPPFVFAVTAAVDALLQLPPDQRRMAVRIAARMAR